MGSVSVKFGQEKFIARETFLPSWHGRALAANPQLRANRYAISCPSTSYGSPEQQEAKMGDRDKFDYLSMI
jgi:hypothetical protein